MAKRQKPADQMQAISTDVMAQAQQAIDTFFDLLKKSASSFPTGRTELGEKLKEQNIRNVTAVHDLVRRLSQAKDFEEALRIQTEFIQSQFQAFTEQMTNLGEVYGKEAASDVKVPFKSSLD